MEKENKPKREKKVRYTRKGKPIKHPVLRVLGRIALVILALILVVVVAGFVSCKTSFTSEGVSGADLTLPQPSQDSAQVYGEFQDNGGELYQSLSSMGQTQSQESFESQAAEASAYDGTDVAQIQEAYCMTCHKQEVLDGYSADADAARQKVESMRDVYGCALTDEQVDALVAAYAA